MNRILPTIPVSGGGLDPATNAFDAPYAVTVFAGAGGAGVCPTQGLVILNGSSLSALTLITPIAGLPSAGGHDGCEVKVYAVAANAHTVTAATACVNLVPGTNTTVATFAATAGLFLHLFACGGIWYVKPPSVGVSFA